MPLSGGSTATGASDPGLAQEVTALSAQVKTAVQVANAADAKAENAVVAVADAPVAMQTTAVVEGRDLVVHRANGTQYNSGRVVVSFTPGTMTALAPGASPTMNLRGTLPDLIVDFGIPKGDPGSPGGKGDKGDVGGKGDKGDTGPTGVVTATSPLTYDPATKTVAIQASSTTQAGSMSAAQAGQLATLNAAKTLYLLNQTFTTPAIGLLGSPTAQTYAVPGAAVGMGVTVNPRASTPIGPLLYAWVSAPNVVSVEIRPLVAVVAASIVIDIHVLPNP